MEINGNFNRIRNSLSSQGSGMKRIKTAGDERRKDSRTTAVLVADSAKICYSNNSQLWPNRFGSQHHQYKVRRAIRCPAQQYWSEKMRPGTDQP